jgi:predicted component of type VI protein secretion system
MDLTPELDVDLGVDVEAQQRDEEGAVHDWRAERLVQLGISAIVAHAVASFVDWHELERLIDRGCAPELALEIVR